MKKNFIIAGGLIILFLITFISTKKICDSMVDLIPNGIFYNTSSESEINFQDLKIITEDSEEIVYPKRLQRILSEQSDTPIQEQSFDTIINHSVIKIFLKQLWKLSVLIALIPILLAAFVSSIHNYMKFYNNFGKGKRRTTCLFFVKATLYPAVSFFLWYIVLSQLSIPGQLLPKKNILDIGHYYREIKTFFHIAGNSQNYILHLQARCAITAIIGYGVSISIAWTSLILILHNLHKYKKQF